MLHLILVGCHGFSDLAKLAESESPHAVPFPFWPMQTEEVVSWEQNPHESFADGDLLPIISSSLHISHVNPLARQSTWWSDQICYLIWKKRGATHHPCWANQVQPQFISMPPKMAQCHHRFTLDGLHPPLTHSRRPKRVFSPPLALICIFAMMPWSWGPWVI